MQFKRRFTQIQHKRKNPRIQHRKQILQTLYRKQTLLLPSMKELHRKRKKRCTQSQNDGPIRFPQRSLTRIGSMPLRPSPPRAMGLPLLRRRQEVFPWR